MRRKGSTGLVAVIAGSNAQSIMASLIEQRAAQDLEAEQHRARSSPDGFTTPSGRPELKPPALAPRQRIVRPDALRMPYDKGEAAMSKREFIAQELERLPEQDLDRLMAFLRSLADAHAEAAIPAAAAESSLAKDWLTPEEDAAWASL